MSELSVALGSLSANGWGCGPVLLLICHPVLEFASHWAKPGLSVQMEAFGRVLTD